MVLLQPHRLHVSAYNAGVQAPAQRQSSASKRWKQLKENFKTQTQTINPNPQNPKLNPKIQNLKT